MAKPLQIPRNCITTSQPTRTAILNLWVGTPLRVEQPSHNGLPKTIRKHISPMVLGTKAWLLYLFPGGSAHMQIRPHTSTRRDDIIAPTPLHTPPTNTGVCDRIGAIMYLCRPVTRVESSFCAESSCCVESSRTGGKMTLHEL